MRRLAQLLVEFAALYLAMIAAALSMPWIDALMNGATS